ncbi:MAG TPA: hypothetical protein VL358_15540 [Caulobacteraceae bacterium]|jgi:hypothetical protein|nr:hypothetical protein [Caulobacteraceae bacterium]
MSCDVAVSAALLLASLNPGHALAPRLIPAVATAPAAGNPLAKEPLFASIVGEAKALGKTVETYRAGLKGAAAAKPLPGLDKFQKRIAALSDLDMKGHLELAARGTDGDLKCILRGISQDLPKKLDELMKAEGRDKQDLALREMGYLLNDNVEVITSPATVQSDQPA